MVVPREHGAWGLLFVPMLTGAAIALAGGGRVLPVLLFATAALALFWLRTPVESLMGTSPIRPQNEAERQPVIVAACALTAVAAAALSALLWSGSQNQLLVIGAVAAAAFVVQASVKKLGRTMRMPAQFVGVVGLTAAGPAAYYAASGRLDHTAIAIWLANWIFAAGQIHFVQLRIHGARLGEFRAKLKAGAAFLAGQAAIIVLLLATWRVGLLPALALLAFVPAVFRGLRWFFRGPQTLAVRTLGWWEVAHSVTFGVLLVLAFLRSSLQ